MDLVINNLIVHEHRIEHIARHQVTIEEVLEVVSGDYVCIRGCQDRWLLIGKTNQGRFLTVIIGERAQENVYGLVTARPARRQERNLYQEITLEQGDEEDAKN